jgi:glyoxylase-like metal-dependent hydrolase (beta-lactamase superfamily II)
MSIRTGVALVIVALAVAPVAQSDAPSVPPPAARVLAPGVWLIPGGILPNREPDGNSVIFAAPAGLVVMDTGRHDWHWQAILALALAQRQVVAAIVNSHWHLDHVSGNPALRAAYPGLRVYASNAIDGALGGFLAASARDNEALANDPQYPEETRADIRADIQTIRNGAALKPDVVIAASGAMTLAGRALDVHLAPDAATSGDVWLYDEHSRIAALGDLVTLPAPFLDTACPEGWRAALVQVAATPFRLAVPGHGEPMRRRQFLRYQRAFGNFIDCAHSARAKEECAANWADAVRPLLGRDAQEPQQSRAMASDYVGMLRDNGGRSRYCAAPG